jgi:predicted nuclease of restriction endonuclease-like (RecB) superfamily
MINKKQTSSRQKNKLKNGSTDHWKKKGILAMDQMNATSSNFSFEALVNLCRRTHEELRSRANRSVDTAMVARNWLIGWYTVEYEQNGADRAEYGKRFFENLSAQLIRVGIKGSSETRLRLYRSFYLRFKGIQPTASVEFRKRHPDALSEIQPTVSVKSIPDILKHQDFRAISSGLMERFSLGWSHYVELLTLENPDERRFYEIEATANSWSVRELERQIASSLYERLALSRDRKEIRRLSQNGQTIEKAGDIIKNPLVLEFLGLEEKPGFSEDELETAIIDKIEHFLLELGKGFLFEARQKRFTFDNDHFYVDLVFYNRLLRCYVLIDLKRDKLTHQDLGQMQMYVNYFDRYIKAEDELPTIGIVLCHRKNDALVELTLPKNANIFASKYQLYLPSKEVLKAQLEKIEMELRENSTENESVSKIEKEKLKKLKHSKKKLMLDE